MIGEKASRVLEQFKLEDRKRNSPRDIVTICQSTEFHIPESRNINIMSHLYVYFALRHTFRKFQNNDGLLDGFRVPQFQRARFFCR